MIPPRTRPEREMLKQLQRAFGDLFKVLHKIFLEATGLFFLILGGLILYSSYAQVRKYLDFGDISYFKVGSTLVFGVLMVFYGVHSFYRARSMK
jgi:hypothetical protein